MFLYVYGGLKRDEVALKKLYQLIDEKQAKVRLFLNGFNFVQKTLLSDPIYFKDLLNLLIFYK